MSDKKTILVWTDFETTGLDQHYHTILEYAVVLTELDMTELGSVEGIVPQDMLRATHKMSEYVLGMHQGNGLIEELIHAVSNTYKYSESIAQAEHDILNLLDKFNEDNVRFVIAGSNVLFDVKWIMKHMPLLANRLDHRDVIEGPESYRCLDVSVYKFGLPHAFTTEEESNVQHRAMDDIRWSMEQQVRMRAVVDALASSLLWKPRTLN